MASVVNNPYFSTAFSLFSGLKEAKLSQPKGSRNFKVIMPWPRHLGRKKMSPTLVQAFQILSLAEKVHLS